MYRKELFPNIFIEIYGSSNGSPPDRQGGMSTNSSTVWQRIIGPNYNTEWCCCTEKSMIKTKNIWELVMYHKDINDAWQLTTYEDLVYKYLKE